MEVWVDEFATMLADAMEVRPLPPPPVAVVLPETDAPDGPAEDLGIAEGQFFMIEYRDGRGRVSSRRITVTTIKRGVGDVPLLGAYCHERGARRSFRIDRVLACVDVDGVVHSDVAAFMAMTFGMPIAVAARRERFGNGGNWEGLRAAIQPYAVLLSALSHSDGTMTQDEVFVVVEHCARVGEDHGFAIGADEMAKIEAYVMRQRPTSQTIWRACAKVFEDGNRIMIDFLRAALAVIDADGDRHPEEVRLINDIAVEMTGVGII